MNVVLPAPVVDHLPRLSGGAIKTYLALSLIKTTAKRYPTLIDLSEYMNVSEKTVLRHMDELMACGHLRKERLAVGGRRVDYVLLHEPTYGG